MATPGKVALRGLRTLHRLASAKGSMDLAEAATALGDVTLDGLLELNPAGMRQVLSSGNIHCITVAETALASVPIFILPPGMALPLHDHPDMDLVCKVLGPGPLHVTAFDWMGKGARGALDSSRANNVCQLVERGWRPKDALCTVSKTFGGGKMHEFVASTDAPACFIDVITPPYYMAPNNIPCTYYDTRELDLEERSWLRSLQPAVAEELCATLEPMSEEPILNMRSLRLVDLVPQVFEAEGGIK